MEAGEEQLNFCINISKIRCEFLQMYLARVNSSGMRAGGRMKWIGHSNQRSLLPLSWSRLGQPHSSIHPSIHPSINAYVNSVGNVSDKCCNARSMPK